MADEVIETNDGTENIRLAPVRPALSGILERIAWGAVWAGVLVAVSMEVLFSLFGLFIGFGMYNYRAANPWGGAAEWSMAWYFVTAAWSMFFGGWIAARLSGNPTAGDGILHGISVWGLATFITLAVVAVGAWAILREGIVVLSTAAITAAQATPGHAPTAAPGAVASNAAQMGQATANLISGLALRLFGGVLLGFVTALLGGWLGRSRSLVVAPQDVVPVPTRRVA
jgi:hypothetical protein